MKLVYEYKEEAVNTSKIIELEKRIAKEMTENRYIKKQEGNYIEWLSLDNDSHAHSWLSAVFMILLVFSEDFPLAVKQFAIYYDKDNKEREDLMYAIPYFSNHSIK